MKIAFGLLGNRLFLKYSLIEISIVGIIVFSALEIDSVVYLIISTFLTLYILIQVLSEWEDNTDLDIQDLDILNQQRRLFSTHPIMVVLSIFLIFLFVSVFSVIAFTAYFAINESRHLSPYLVVLLLILLSPALAYIAAIANFVANGLALLPRVWKVPKAQCADMRPDDDRIREWMRKSAGTSGSFAIGITASFFITAICLALGNVIELNETFPITWQLLFVNFMFDGATAAVTFSLLTWATTHPNLWRLPIAIIFDVILGAIFALASLYLSLLGTSWEVSLRGTLNVLVGLSVDGRNLHLGSHFWVMHTVFIPTLILMFLLFFTWLSKVFLLGVSQVAQQGYRNFDPLKFTIGYLHILLGISSIAAAYCQFHDAKL